MLATTTTAQRLRFAAIVALVSPALACRRDRTQIVVVVDSDFAIPTGLSALRVSVPIDDDGGQVFQVIDLQGVRGVNCEDSTSGSSRFCIPLSFLVEPRHGRSLSTPLLIRVEGLAPGADTPERSNAVVERAARLQFRPGLTLRVPMFLGVACRGVVCPGGLTCIDGACVSVDTPIGIAVIEPTRGSEFDGGRDVMSNTDVSTGIVDGTADGSGALMTDSAAVDAGTDATTDAGVLTCAAARCPPIARIASIGDFTCALTAAGRIACWGANDEGQLGRGTILMRVGQGGGEPVPAYLRNAPSARAVLVAETHACLVTSPAQGEVWCWGNNALGSLGVGFVRSPLPDPARVPNFSTMGPLLFSGANRSIYWRTLNGLFAWGDNSDGALGTASANAVVTSASLVSMDRRMDSLSACGRGACWTEAQSIVCVGVNGGLRFGPVSALDETLRTPTRLPANFQADSVYVGDGYSCLLFQGVVKCWGENRASGILGAVPNAGDPALVSEPQTVQFGAPDIRVRSLALGGDFALAMTNTGQVFCWGSNAEGTCATGSIGPDGAVTPEHTTPTPLVFPPEFLSPVQMIAAGRSHACAVDSRDGIFCWGRNSRAQVGRPWSDDPRMRRFTRPVPVLLP